MNIKEMTEKWTIEEKAEFFETMAAEQSKTIKSIQSLVLSMFELACLKEDGMYDHCHYPPYKEAQKKLIEWGLIKGCDCKRF